MANVRKENVGIINGVELFITHWKYGHDYESSTVLTDPQYNIIAFYDRGTKNIDRIEVDLPFDGGFIVANGKGIEVDCGNITYKPYDFEMARNFWKEEVKRLNIDSNGATLLWQGIKTALNEYNKNYFNNLLKEIGK